MNKRLITWFVAGLTLPSGLALAQDAPMTPDFEEPGAEEAAPAETETTQPSMEAELDMQADAIDSEAAGSSSGADAASGWAVGVAPRVGLAVPTSKLGLFASFGLELGYRLPVMEQRLSLIVDGSFTRPGRDSSVDDMRVGGAADYSIDESEIKAGLGGNFRIFTDDKRLVPWVGAAMILQRLESTETNDLAPGENTAVDTRFGGELSLGADVGLGPGYLLGEIRTVFTDLNDLITGNSNAGNVNLSVGYRFTL